VSTNCTVDLHLRGW